MSTNQILVPIKSVFICFFLSTWVLANNQANPTIFVDKFKSQSFIWSDDTDKLSGQHKYLLARKYAKEAGKKDLALKYLRDSANKGFAKAQYELGMKFYDGEQLKRNHKSARSWFSKAAMQAHIKAQFQLGLMYKNAEGGEQNLSQAIRLLEKAAENGHGGAQHALAVTYLSNDDNKDIRQAMFWLKKSVQQNNPDAQRDLGFLFYQGLGTPKDYKQAVALLSEPASQGNPMSQYLLGEIYAKGGYGIGQQKEKSQNWYKLALQSGYPDAKLGLQKLQKSPNKSRSFVVKKNTVPKLSNFNVKQLHKWKKSWEKKDIDSYLNFYSRNFKGKSGSYKSWAKYRRKVIRKSDNIRIKIRNVQTKVQNPRNILVSFNQKYYSDSYSDQVFKKQHWRKEKDSQWRIVSEYTN